MRSISDSKSSWTVRGGVMAALPLVLTLALAACGGGGGNSPTQPPPPAPNPPPAPGPNLVGIVGCSQTTNAWRGWLDIEPAEVWTLQSGYGGGDIAEWADEIPNGDYWTRLDANIAGNAAANVVWWQICDLAARNGTFADADQVIAEIRNRIPGATIYVSPLAEFEKPETCVKQDIPNSVTLADYVVNTGQALRGPDLPTVLDAWIQPPQGDGNCHVGLDGRAQFGATVSTFPW